MLFIQYLLQIKQNVHSTCTVRVAVATKNKEKSRKISFLKAYHFSGTQNVSDAKMLDVQEVIAEYICRKRSWQQMAKIVPAVIFVVYS